ncbi:transposase [Xylanibacter muris]|uniref:transposase n=1 Tax=Xylanibacter muris TaxID=2736290 RepID=UPI003D80D6E5
MTILVCYHFCTFANFKHYYIFYVEQHLSGRFPDAVSYNRFVELMPRVFFYMMLFMKLHAFGKCCGISFVDSTMIPVCHNLRRYANRVSKDVATDDKETMGWCHGFKLHLICNDSEKIITLCLTGANVDNRNKRV